MNKIRSRYLIYILLLLGIIVVITGSATPIIVPPAVQVFVAAPPKDLRVYIDYNHPNLPEPLEMSRSTRGWETYFEYYYMKNPGRFDEDFHTADLVVRSEKYNFEVKIPPDPQMRMYRRMMYLNLKNESLSFKQPTWRKPAFVLGHTLLALILKGVILYLFGIRWKATWKIFLIINLVTQLWLSFYLADVYHESYATFALYFFAGALAFGEAIAVWITADEIKKGSTALFFVFFINLVSLFIGDLILPHFPR